MNDRQKTKATAGLRGAHWDPIRLPSDCQLSTHPLRTADGAVTCGFLFTRGRSTTVVCLMHPREVVVSHYLVPDILSAGAAVWVQAPRSPGNDLRLEHELALLDVGAGMEFLRSQGFRRVVCLGNSGGAGLYALYAEQSSLPPATRLSTTPAGRPTGLEAANLPPVEGVIFVAAHPGQGKLLQSCIDPSVTNEADALSVDPELDPFAEQNGYCSNAGATRYSRQFILKYRRAQEDRVRRIDVVARRMLEERQAARRKLKAGGGRADAIAAAYTPIMTIWRTDADLRCHDLTLDPSDRRVGSLWGTDPIASNYGSVGFGRICTPESWLSTWSGLSSRASLLRCAPSIEQPCLFIEYTGDSSVFPSDAVDCFAALRAGDKQHLRIRGDHQGQALEQGEAPGRLAAGAAIQKWLTERFCVPGRGEAGAGGTE